MLISLFTEKNIQKQIQGVNEPEPTTTFDCAIDDFLSEDRLNENDIWIIMWHVIRMW